MAPSRHVPLIVGIFATAVAIGLWSWLRGWPGIAAAILPGAVGIASIRTAFSASDREIQELTGARPMTADTAQKLSDRV